MDPVDKDKAMWLTQPKQRILVTGGTGFIGTALCQQLTMEGHLLTVLTRDAVKAQRIFGASLREIEHLHEIPRDCTFDVVINLAGEPLASGRWSNRRKAKFVESRIGTTEALLGYFKDREQHPDVLVNGSAIGYYGPHNDEVLDETGHGVPSFSHSLCRDWESAADAFTELGTRVCKIRTGIVLGPHGGALKSMMPSFRLGLGGPMGSGRQWMSWIHRQDLIRLIYHCINHSTIQGVLNGTAPNPVRNEEFCQALAAALGKRAPLRVPAPMLRLLMGEMADELLLSGQQVVPSYAQESGFEFEYPELQGALANVVGSWR